VLLIKGGESIVLHPQRLKYEPRWGKRGNSGEHPGANYIILKKGVRNAKEEWNNTV